MGRGDQKSLVPAAPERPRLAAAARAANASSDSPGAITASAACSDRRLNRSAEAARSPAASVSKRGSALAACSASAGGSGGAVSLTLLARRNNTPRSNQGGFAFQGAGASPSDAATPAQYSPAKVGNDASARPWEHNATAFDATPERSSGSSMAGAAGAAGGSMIGSALSGAQSWGIPAGFDVDGFLGAAKRNFVTLQDAWDRSDITMLRSMMTDAMVGEIRSQLAERETHTGGQPNKTEVVMLDAQLLGIEELPDAYMASVEFSGMIREDASAGPSPFREVWNMTKPVDGRGGWVVAGVQALQ